ncbi:hypothetical protein ACH4FX_38990 [Streptomyces sp. NPDC018019]|uniref:hypothetical protein n=1 Tax=Streptomyces sp. NPDC018019 TaxID=3365030 RepID=UPI0037B8BB95
MARIVFDPDEADSMRRAARDAFPQDPALAYALLQLADEGVDLDYCRTWDDIRAERGLPPHDEAAHDVA